jgi:uncharacterized protein
MTDPAETVDALQRYVASWEAGDLEALLAAYDDDVVFHYFGTTDLAGAHHGKEAAVAAMAAASTRAQRQLLEVVDVLAGSSLGAVVVRERLTRGDLAADLRRLFVYRIEGGLIVECWVHDEDQALVDRFWAPAD